MSLLLKLLTNQILLQEIFFFCNIYSAEKIGLYQITHWNEILNVWTLQSVQRCFYKVLLPGPHTQGFWSNGLEYGLSIGIKNMSSHTLIRVPEKWFKCEDLNEWATYKSVSKVNAAKPVLRRMWPEISNIWNAFVLLAGAVFTKGQTTARDVILK